MSRILVCYFSLRFLGFFWSVYYAARKGYSALPLTFPPCLGDRGFVDICCMSCRYYKSEATFQASAHSELSCTSDNEKYKWENFEDVKRELFGGVFYFKAF